LLLVRGSGIGKAISVLFAKEVADVIIIGRKQETLEETCKIEPKKISYVIEDITKEESIKNLIEYVDKKFGKLDILVNNAGMSISSPLKDLNISNYDKIFNLDVRALVNVTIQCLPLILKSKGNILNISSIVGSICQPAMSMYSGAKAAINNFTKCWALELAKDGVRVNAIAPGAIDTNIFDKSNGSSEKSNQFKEYILKHIPLGRFGTPDEVATLALFLVSKEASYITGSIYDIDGGINPYC
jgi:NAD(P)-dependent dehydrogenase (short-subunit alcohol dehydrogenase family)